jgi:hypothetical protein
VLNTTCFVSHFSGPALCLLVPFALVKLEELLDAIINFTNALLASQVDTPTPLKSFNLDHSLPELLENVVGCSQSRKDV